MRVSASDIDAVARLIPLLTELVGAWSRRRDTRNAHEQKGLPKEWSLEELLARQEGVESPEKLAEEGMVKEIVQMIQQRKGWQG